jgi:NAD(P)-dependent dehydrogenase (short-subunit alcohol dehydrogenase family)
VIKEIIGKFNRIHTIINCAGFDIDQKIISELSADSFNEVMQSDVQGFFNIVNSTLGHLSEKGGSYIFMSSAGLLKYPPGDILSVAPKAAIEQLIKGIAKEEGANNIRANSIALGIVDAGIFHRLKHQNDSFFDEDWESELMNALPLKRYASPREVAELTLFLASNEAGYITGQMIAIDGGYSI